MSMIYRNNRIVAGLFLGILLFVSCYQDPIVIDLEGLDEKIVIEGFLTNDSEPITIRVSRPVPLDDTQLFDPVAAADVMLEESTGQAENLVETEPGVYETQTMTGTPTRSYELTVTVDGKTYMGTSTMPEAIPLDSIQVIETDGRFSLRCVFRDRPGVEDFHWIQIYEDGCPDKDFLYHGTHSDGELIVRETEPRFRPGTRIDVEFMTMERQAFEYIMSIRVIADQFSDTDAGQFDPELPEFVPVMLHNPKSNLSNGAFGFFFAIAVREYGFTI